MPLSHSVRNARWRKSQGKKTSALLSAVNAKRAQLNLPKFSLEIPRKSRKGKTAHEYKPSREMNGGELREWRAGQRKMRKAETQRINRMKNATLLKSLELQMIYLDEAIKKKKKVEELDPKIIDAATIIKECVEADQKSKDTSCTYNKSVESELHSLIISTGEYIDYIHELERLLTDPLIELDEIHAARGFDATSCIHVSKEAFYDIPIPNNAKDDMFIDTIDKSIFDNEGMLLEE